MTDEELKPLSGDDIERMQRAYNSTYSGVPLKWREYGHELLVEVRRLRAENARLAYELAEEKNATDNDRDIDYRLERSASQNNALATTIIGHVATIEELRAENVKLRKAQVTYMIEQGAYLLSANEKNVELATRNLELRAENARQAETIARLQKSANEYAELAYAVGYAHVADHCPIVPGPIELNLNEVTRLKRLETEQAETIAKLREKINWALRYLAGEDGAEPIDATLVLREALKESEG